MRDIRQRIRAKPPLMKDLKKICGRILKAGCKNSKTRLIEQK